MVQLDGSSFSRYIDCMSEWLPKHPNADATALVIRGKTIPRPIVQILKNRGYDTPRQIEKFFAPSLDQLYDPFLLPDMERAADRLALAAANAESVLIHGDYDTDGITATALLYTRLHRLGVRVHYFLPNRFEEGYGLSRTGVEEALRHKCSLLIAVDCGITAVEEVKYARQQGLDVIICDHHLPPLELPAALAVINPKLVSSQYPFPDLAGVGVAFKLIQALDQRLGRPAGDVFEDLDLVALGTVVDVVPLIDENRCLVKYGLNKIKSSHRPAFQALLAETGITDRVYAYHLGFRIGPRINACGRLRDAREALELFLSDDPTRCAEIVRRLSADNQERQAIQDRILEAARVAIEQQGRQQDRVIVLADPAWHEGVVGIVAARLSEELHRPAILLAVKETTAKGSGRSIPGFDLAAALYAARACLIKFGGHKQAAGLELKRNDIDDFRHRINDYAAGLPSELFVRKRHYDLRLDLNEITPELVYFLSFFEPTGLDNPEPIFYSEDLQVVGIPKVVAGRHLRFALRQGNRHFPAIAFQEAEQILHFVPGQTRLNCLYKIDEDSYTGKRKIEIKIREWEVCRS